MFRDKIKHGDKVTILIPAGIGRNGQEWKEATGKAVMHSSPVDGWVLNMGGPHGTPGIATEENTVKINRRYHVPTGVFPRGRADVCLCGAPSKDGVCSVKDCVCSAEKA
jgi:hypothetical protein